MGDRCFFMMKHALKFVLQMGILIFIYQTGNFVVSFFHLPFPGNVLGIVILFFLLWLGIIKVNHIETAANWLLKHLGFFFIPISVGLMTLGNTLIKNGLPVLLVLIVSAFVGLVSAGKTAQAIIIKNEKDQVNQHDHAI